MPPLRSPLCGLMSRACRERAPRWLLPGRGLGCARCGAERNADRRRRAQPAQPFGADAQDVLGERRQDRDHAAEQHRDQVEADRVQQRAAPEHESAVGGAVNVEEPRLRAVVLDQVVIAVCWASQFDSQQMGPAIGQEDDRAIARRVAADLGMHRAGVESLVHDMMRMLTVIVPAACLTATAVVVARAVRSR